METVRYIIISFISGLTAIVPGVSGGTIFAIFGISEKMANDINYLIEGVFFTSEKTFKKFYSLVITHGKLPIIIGLGSLISSLIYAKVIVLFGNQFEFLFRFLFIGLVIFSIPTLWGETKHNNLQPKSKIELKYLYVIIGFVLSYLLFNSNETELINHSSNFNSFSYLFKFFLISLVAGITGILPGISGTNILIIGGVFENYILFSSQITHYPFQYFTYILGIIIGSIFAAKCFTFLFKHFRRGFFSFMTGLTASTIIFIWSYPTSSIDILQSIIGIILSYFLIKTLMENENKASLKKNS